MAGRERKKPVASASQLELFAAASRARRPEREDGEVDANRCKDCRNRFLSDHQVAGRYDVSRATVWRWVKNPLFPKPLKLSKGTSRWRLSDLVRFEREIQRHSAFQSNAVEGKGAS